MRGALKNMLDFGIFTFETTVVSWRSQCEDLKSLTLRDQSETRKRFQRTRRGADGESIRRRWKEGDVRNLASQGVQNFSRMYQKTDVGRGIYMLDSSY
jgi:hypothetical protein